MTVKHIILLSLRSDGEIAWLARGKEYTYLIDAGHLQYIEQLARYAPGRAFNFTKTHGTLIEKGGEYVNSIKKKTRR